MGGRYSLPYLIYSFSMEPLIVCLRMSMYPHIFIIYIIANFPVTISACAHVRNLVFLNVISIAGIVRAIFNIEVNIPPYCLAVLDTTSAIATYFIPCKRNGSYRKAESQSQQKAQRFFEFYNLHLPPHFLTICKYKKIRSS